MYLVSLFSCHSIPIPLSLSTAAWKVVSSLTEYSERVTSQKGVKDYYSYYVHMYMYMYKPYMLDVCMCHCMW